MTELPFKFDEIGYWSELKLEIVGKYGAAYTTAFNRSPNLKKYYIDAFSGAGIHISKKTGTQVEGSPARALNVSPPFDGFYFIDLDEDKTDYLRSMCSSRPDVHIHTGDSNKYLVEEVLPKIQYNKFTRALCLLDPYALDLDWGVILQAGQSKAVDLFLNFPVMDMNRNAIWRSPDKAPQGDIDRMNRFWGDESWRQAAYAESKQTNLFFKPALEKQDNDAIVGAFQKRLKAVAGFEFVPDPPPMRNSNNAVVYYLFFRRRSRLRKTSSPTFSKSIGTKERGVHMGRPPRLTAQRHSGALACGSWKKRRAIKRGGKSSKQVFVGLNIGLSVCVPSS